MVKKGAKDVPSDGNSANHSSKSEQGTVYDYGNGNSNSHGNGLPEPSYAADNGYRKSHSRMSGLDAAMEEFRREQSQRVDYSKRSAYDPLENVNPEGDVKDPGSGQDKSRSRMHGRGDAMGDQGHQVKKTVYAEKDPYAQPGDIRFNDAGPPDLPSVQTGTDRTVPEDAEDSHRKSHSRMSGLDTAMEEFRREQSKRVDYDKRGVEDALSDTGTSSDIPFEPPGKEAPGIPEPVGTAGSPANISQDDINRQMQAILEKRKRMSTNAAARVTEASAVVGTSGIRMGLEQTIIGDGNEVGVGINTFRENAMPFLKVISSSLRGSMALSMASSLTYDMKFQKAFAKVAGLRDAKGNLIFKGINPNRLTLKDMQKIAAGSRRILYGAGITNLNGRPAFMRLQIHKAWATGRLSNGFTGSQIAALAYVANQANKVSGVGNPSKVTIFRIGRKFRLQAGAGKVAMFRFAKRKVFKTMKQDETFNAMYMTGRFLKQARSILSKIIKIFGFPIRLAKIASKKALAAARKGTNAAKRTLLSTRAGQRMAGSAVGQTISGAASATGQAAGGARNTARGAKRGIKRATDGLGRLVRKPLHIVTAPFRAVRTIMRIPFMGRYNPLRIILNFLGKILAAFQIVQTFVIAVIVFLLVFIIIIGILLMFLTSSAGAYDFESKSAGVRKLCFDTINQCYSEQIQELSNVSATYNNVTITTVDRKSNKAYENNMNYTETTNVTELISMAIVYFDADIDKYAPEPWETLFSGITSIVKPDNPLETYLKEMYYGSHEIDVNPDEEGESAEVTVTTYYFDDLFNCSRSTSFLGNYGGTYDGTGEMIKVKIRAKSAPRARCSAYANKGDSQGGGFEPNAREYYTYALLGSGSWYKDQVHPPGGWHGNTSEHGTYVVINIPEKNKGEKGIYGNVIYRKGSEGGGAGDRVFDIFWDEASSYQKAGFGDPVCKTYIPDPSGEMEIEALIRDVDVGEPVENIPGFISKETTTVLNVDALPHAKEFLGYLQKYSDIIKANHSHVHKDGSANPKDPNKFFKKLTSGKDVYTNCVVPFNLALVDMHIKSTSNSSTNYSGSGKSFNGVTSGMKKHMKVINSGGPVGMKFKDAADKKLLQPGDIIGFKGLQHGFVYSGNGYICYDGGGQAVPYKNGIEVDYSHSYKSYHISVILRWTD